MRRFARLTLLLTTSLIAAPLASADSVSTFTLDALSHVSFGTAEILYLPSGSTIRFHFAEPAADGSVAFTISPADVSMEPADVPGGGSMQYRIAGPTSGVMTQTSEGRRISFYATVVADLETPNVTGAFNYSMTFTTEAVAAQNSTGTETVARTGLRLIDGVWYGQLVAATTNKDNAFPEPGAAVYTVLSGAFDQIP